MADIKRVTLTKDDEQPKHVEIEHDTNQGAMAAAEAAHDGWRAVGAHSVFTAFKVTIEKDGDFKTLHVDARDVMDAKRIAEALFEGYEMRSCLE